MTPALTPQQRDKLIDLVGRGYTYKTASEEAGFESRCIENQLAIGRRKEREGYDYRDEHVAFLWRIEAAKERIGSTGAKVLVEAAEQGDRKAAELVAKKFHPDWMDKTTDTTTVQLQLVEKILQLMQDINRRAFVDPAEVYAVIHTLESGEGGGEAVAAFVYQLKKNAALISREREAIGEHEHAPTELEVADV
jgi:hypothetical protein